MKTFILLAFISSFIVSFSAFGAELSACKTEANTAALEAYDTKGGESMIYTKSKFKPIIEGDTIIHIIQILDFERSNYDILRVTLNRFNCNVISID